MNRNHRNLVKILALGVTLLFLAAGASALDLSRKKKSAERKLYIPVTKKDRCPVCGMFVHPYQKWITQIQFKDGSHHSFDGMKCLSRYYFNPAKFDVAPKKREVERVLVREYYTLKFISHEKAYYVIGSDVHGPMGHELIPFDDEKSAEIFLIDHNGLKILRFNQIDAELLDKLDRARKTLRLE